MGDGTVEVPRLLAVALAHRRPLEWGTWIIKGLTVGRGGGDTEETCCLRLNCHGGEHTAHKKSDVWHALVAGRWVQEDPRSFSLASVMSPRSQEEIPKARWASLKEKCLRLTAGFPLCVFAGAIQAPPPIKEPIMSFRLPSVSCCF